MTIDIGTIPESELDLLVSAVRFVEPSEENGFGLLVTCVDGIRTWQMNMNDMWVTIRGEKHSFEGVFVIPGRLFVGSAAFGDADHSCNISIEGNIAVATAPSGSQMKLELMSKVPELKTFTENETVTAEVSFREFQKICSLLGDAPMDFSDYKKMYSEPPVGRVCVEEGVVRLERSWAYVNCPDTVVSVPAKTSGTGTFDLCHTLLDGATNRIFLPGDPITRISFDPVQGEYMHLRADHLSLHLDRRVDGSAKFFPLVKEYLDERKIEHQVHAGGLIAANYKDTVIRMQLFDGPDPILHCTVTALYNVRSTVALMRQLNEFNATRIGTSVWFDNGMIVIGADMRCSTTGKLTPILDSLAREACDLGDFLKPTFGGTTSPAAL